MADRPFIKKRYAGPPKRIIPPDITFRYEVYVTSAVSKAMEIIPEEELIRIRREEKDKILKMHPDFTDKNWKAGLFKSWLDASIKKRVRGQLKLMSVEDWARREGYDLGPSEQYGDAMVNQDPLERTAFLNPQAKPQQDRATPSFVTRPPDRPPYNPANRPVKDTRPTPVVGPSRPFSPQPSTPKSAPDRPPTSFSAAPPPEIRRQPVPQPIPSPLPPRSPITTSIQPPPQPDRKPIASLTIPIQPKVQVASVPIIPPAKDSQPKPPIMPPPKVVTTPTPVIEVKPPVEKLETKPELKPAPKPGVMPGAPATTQVKYNVPMKGLLRDQVVALLKQAPEGFTMDELAEILEKATQSFLKPIHHLHETDIIEKVGEKWRLKK